MIQNKKVVHLEDENTSTKSINTDGKVKCEICGYTSHMLFQHLKEAHKMTATDYVEKYDAPVFSKLGADILKPYLRSSETRRDFEEVSVEQVFGWKGEKLLVKRYLGDAPWVPTGDDSGYHYDYDATMALLYSLSRPKRNAAWIYGYSGTGKTQLVINVCRRLNRELARVNMDASVTRSYIVGDWTYVGGETKFVYGILPQAMMRGAVLLLDEFDLGNPHIIPVFRSVIEDSPSLCILENGGEVITPHPDFRIVVAANTAGMGDETGLYGNTNSLSLADRQRFSIFVHMEYMEPKVEQELLVHAVADLSNDEAEKIVQVANGIRTQYKEGKIEESVSPRQLINWAEIFSVTGNALTAANMAFLLPLTQSTQVAIRQLIEAAGLPVA